MKILYFVLFLLVAGLILFLLNQTIRKMVYPLSRRYLHCRIIPTVFVVLLAATNVYTVSYLLQYLDQLINLPYVSAAIKLILPNRAYELVYMLLVILGLNLAVTLLVILIIGVTKLIFSASQDYINIEDYYGIAKVLHLPWFVVAKVYEEDDNGVIRLSAKGRTMGIWAKGIKWAVAILWILELLCLAVSILWGSDSWNTTMLTVVRNWYLLPMAAFLLLQQIQYFLEDALEEEAGSAGSMPIEEKQCGSIHLLMDTYHMVFGNSQALLLTDRKSSILLRDGLSSNDLGNQQIEDCTQPDVLNVISNQLQQSGVQQNEQYQNALVELLNGHSVNICDRCEGQFLPFLCAYLNFHMSQGHTALVLCSDRKRADQLCAAIREQMRRLNSLYSVWNVCTLESADNNNRISMLVGSVDDFLTYQVSQKRQDFSEDVFCAVLADGMELLSRDQLCTQRLFGLLRSHMDIRQYITFTNVNNDALRTALEQAINQETMPFSDDVVYGPDSGVMVWGEESHHRLQQHIGIGSTISHYMGAALPLALTAIKYDFPRVYLIGSDSHGVFAYNDVLSMSAKEITDFIGKKVNLKSLIRYQADEAMRKQDLSVTIVYDTDYNFLNAMMFWQKYGGSEGALLHIISPAYALREYFAANYHKKRFNLKNNEFNALIPHHLGTRTSHMLELLVALCEGGLTEQELTEKAKAYGWAYDNVNLLLHDCLKTVLALDEIHSVYECFHFEEEKTFCAERSCFEVQTRVSLIDSTIRSRLCALSDSAVFVSKDNHTQPLPILAGNICNYFLPRQIMPVNGYLYEVLSVNDGTIHAEQVLPQRIPEYFQISDFAFNNYRQTGAGVDIGCMNLKICTAEVTRKIHGYVASNYGNHFAGGDYLVSSFDAPMTVHTDSANILQINIRRSEFGEQAPQAMNLLAYLVKDFAKTLFPATHQNLFAAIVDGSNSGCVQRVLQGGTDADINDLVCSLIPTVVNTPEADPDYISLYVVECSCIEFGMVQMLMSRYQKLIMMLMEYLSWYLEPGEAAPAAAAEGEAAPVQPSTAGRYLNFGLDTIPAIFAPEALLRLCGKVIPGTETASEAAPVMPTTQAERCTFCDRPTMFPVVLSDNRRMCAHCKDHQLTQKDEIKTLLADTITLLSEGYQITLPRNLHVRFQSSEAIAREAGFVDGGRILGFYNYGNHQLWLEARGPKIAMQSTLIHELTHAWQHYSDDFSQKLQKVLRKYPRKKRNIIRLLIVEGHAVYMEVETMRRMHEEAYADRLHASYMQRQDEYGVGYRLVRDYLIQQSTLGSHMTPFNGMIQFLQDIIDGKVVISE